MTVSVALEALTRDAQRWDTVSGELGKAAGAAAGLGLSEQVFSFAGGSVASTYESVRAQVEQMLRGGVTETAGAAAALRQVRTAYESTDEATRTSLQGLWTAE